MALGLFGSRVRPGGRGGIYSTMDGLGAGPAASSYTVTPVGVTYTPAPNGGMKVISTVSQAALDQLVQQQAAAPSSMTPVLVIGGLALGGFLLYKHFKKGR